MRMGGRVPHLPRHRLLAVAGLLGAAVVVLPAVASSEASPTIEAVNQGVYSERHYWKPSEATLSPGGTVAFSNPTSVYHGVEWKSPPATPSCTGVPLSTSPKTSGAFWNGTCTFSQPGVYTFWCTVHGSEMSGKVTVSANGETTTTTTTPSTTTTTTSSPGYTQPAAGPGGSAPASPLAGSAASAVHVPASLRGRSMRGSVDIAEAGAGGRLQVDLLAKSASLASAKHAAQVRVGRLALAHVHAGRVSFAVALSSRARAALRRHGRLALTATVRISSPTGRSVTIARKVLMRR